MTRSRLSLVAALSVAVLGLGVSSPAEALFRAFPKTGTIVEHESFQRFFVSHHGGIQTIVIKPSFTGRADQFGLVFPTPSIPDFSEGPDPTFFDDLDRLAPEPMAPEVVAMPAPPCPPDGPCDMLAGQRSNVEAIIRVGDYEATVLRESSVGDLVDWLTANDFAFDSEAMDTFEYYVQRRWHFVALRVNVQQVDPGKEYDGELPALTLRYSSQRLTLPMRIAYSQADRAIDWTIFADTDNHLLPPRMGSTVFAKKIGDSDLVDRPSLNPLIVNGDVVSRVQIPLDATNAHLMGDVILEVATIPGSNGTGGGASPPTARTDVGCSVGGASGGSAAGAGLGLLAALGLLLARRRQR